MPSSFSSSSPTRGRRAPVWQARSHPRPHHRQVSFGGGLIWVSSGSLNPTRPSPHIPRARTQWHIITGTRAQTGRAFMGPPGITSAPSIWEHLHSYRFAGVWIGAWQRAWSQGKVQLTSTPAPLYESPQMVQGVSTPLPSRDRSPHPQTHPLAGSL